MRLVAIPLLAVMATCSTEPPPQLDFEESSEYAHEPIGISGAYTREFELVVERSRTDEAEQVYLEYLHSPDAETRLYGLLGLKIIESDKYPKYLEEILADDSIVNYGASGCSIMPERSSFVAELLDKSPVDERARSRFED
ncbi:MAG: hypothetical protein P8X81_09205 [Woeseiaceae bacterium]|jgi:hypothetical protein